MSEPKLTEAQAELLEAMRRGVRCIYMPYAGWFNPAAYYLRTDSHKRCTKTAKALLKKGFVKQVGIGHDVKLVPNEHDA